MGCASRIHVQDGYSRDFGFVVDEGSQLMEAPGVVAATLRFLNCCLAAYSFQVF